MNSIRLIFGSVALVWVANTYSYEVNTHEQLSREAVGISMLGRKMADFGLADVNKGLVVGDTNVTIGRLVFCPPTLSTTARTALELIALGSICEDAADGTAQPLRFLNHFYDPQNGGTGLDFLGRHVDSLTWALDPQDALTSQQYSVRRAKQYLVSSLILPTTGDRQQNLGLLFRTLGHLVHLVQDLGQPQHTRNDSHGRGSGFETYVDKENRERRLTYGGYPTVAATRFDDIWHTAAFAGLADYSSRGFVSAGTTFRGVPGVTGIQADPNYPLPDASGAVLVARQITDSDLLGPSGPSQPLRGEIRFVSTQIVDNYLKTTDINSMTSSYSLFAEDLQHYVGYTQFSVNSFTYREAAKRLIPRAVGYSAGFLDYFFRGSLRIAPPDAGVFAIVNHSPGDPVPAGCGTPCGFGTLKLKVSNTTAGESMGAGTLLLIAKYHLNNCYSPDLSGEFGGPNYTGANCRSAEESIALSDIQTVTEVRDDFSDKALTFTFASPIPINATDLGLQMLFRGELGKESDAVAFSMTDIFEPTFLIFNNDNDYFNVYNLDGSYSSTYPYLPAPGRSSVHVELRFNQSAPSPIATNAQLDPGFYHRLAILTDQEFLPYWMVEQYIGSDPDTREFTLAASENQTDADDQAFNFPTYVPLRRTTPTAFAYEADEDGGAIYWVPGYRCVDDSTRCKAEDKTTGAVVRRFPPFRQPTPVPMDIDF